MRRSCAWGHRGRSGRRRRWGGNLIGRLLRTVAGRTEKPRNHTDSGVVAEILQAYSRYGNTLMATRRALEAAMAGGRPAEQRTDLKQRSLLVRFGRRGVKQLVADHLDRGLTYTEIAKKYDVALSTVGKYIQQAKRQRAEAPAQ